MQLNRRILWSALALFIAFPALADGPIIPIEAAILLIAGVVVGGLAAAFLVSLIIKSVLQKLLNEKRKRLWIMGLTTFVSACLFYFLEEEYDWMYYSNVELNYGYETRIKLYNTLFVLSALFGSVAGYFCLQKSRD